jgi:hypothetical protein
MATEVFSIPNSDRPNMKVKSTGKKALQSLSALVTFIIQSSP